MHRLGLAFFAVVLTGISLGVSMPEETGAAIPIVDAHLHFLNFVQETDGLEALLKAMDQANVQETMISGMPLAKKWDAGEPKRPGYYLDNDSPVYWYSLTDVLVADSVVKLPPETRRRFHPFISGFNPTDMNAVQHVIRMIQLYPDFWEGIGEVMGRHDDLTALTPGEPSRANHPSLQPIYRFAAEHGMPVSIHSNLSSVGESKTPLYLHEIEEMLKTNPKTKFIWCHAGISRRIVVPGLVGLLRGLLNRFSNVTLDLSWVIYENYIAPNGVADPEWIRLVEDFPDRFLLGSDVVGKWGDYPKEIRKFDPFLKRLSPSTAEKVASQNYRQLLPAKGIRIKF